MFSNTKRAYSCLQKYPLQNNDKIFQMSPLKYQNIKTPYIQGKFWFYFLKKNVIFISEH